MHTFSYYNSDHIWSLLWILIVGFLLLQVPRCFPKRQDVFARWLGVLVLFTNLFEGIWRVQYEGFTFSQVMPLHFCSVSGVLIGLYLLTQRDFFFQVSYYFSFGAVLALVLPGVSVYETRTFFYLFMMNHGFVPFGVLYGYLWLGSRPSYRGLWQAIGLTVGLFVISLGYNDWFFTNFMFTKSYIISWARIVQPFILYQIGLLLAFLGVMMGMYLPFRTRK